MPPLCVFQFCVGHLLKRLMTDCVCQTKDDFPLLSRGQRAFPLFSTFSRTMAAEVFPVHSSSFFSGYVRGGRGEKMNSDSPSSLIQLHSLQPLMCLVSWIYKVACDEDKGAMTG